MRRGQGTIKMEKQTVRAEEDHYGGPHSAAGEC